MPHARSPLRVAGRAACSGAEQHRLDQLVLQPENGGPQGIQMPGLGQFLAETLGLAPEASRLAGRAIVPGDGDADLRAEGTHLGIRDDPVSVETELLFQLRDAVDAFHASSWRWEVNGLRVVAGEVLLPILVGPVVGHGIVSLGHDAMSPSAAEDGRTIPSRVLLPSLVGVGLSHGFRFRVAVNGSLEFVGGGPGLAVSKRYAVLVRRRPLA